MVEIVDAHHHLWRYDPDEYAWIAPEMEVLQSDFLPGSLEIAMRSAGVGRSVVVQARQSIEETNWLLDIAEASRSIIGVVGWLPLADRRFERLLESYVTRRKLKGLRHVIQDETDSEFMLGSTFNAGIAALRGTGITYDLLVYAHQLPKTIQFVTGHPEQAFVLDHCGKPAVGVESFDAWRRNLLRLSEHGNVFCKISGLATQVGNHRCSLDDLRPYLEAALEAFGSRRLIAGSDWPVCLLESTYSQWWSALQEWASAFSDEDRTNIFGATARRFYNLDSDAALSAASISAAAAVVAPR